MAKPRKQQSFEEIKEEWEARLQASGFQDIEKEIAGTRVLKQWASYAYRKQTDQEARDAKLAYFTLLSQQLSDNPRFEDESDGFIMRRISEGVGIMEISREMKSLGLRKHNRDTIRYVQRRYEHRWGIKIWKPEEMVSRKVRIK